MDYLKNKHLLIERELKMASTKDPWKSFMYRGAKLCKYDIPFCPITATTLQSDIVTWEEAKNIHTKALLKHDYDYTCDAFVCFYMFDNKFDGPRRGIWNDCKHVLEVLRHFAGVITPDFSTYQDLPEGEKIRNTCRMRAMGYWLGQLCGFAVINNVRWGTQETYRYCFVGIPSNSIVSIGTVGGSPRKKIDRNRFELGLYEMVKVLVPHTIIVYGSDRYPCFDKLRNEGIKIISFPSRTARVFAARKYE